MWFSSLADKEQAKQVVKEACAEGRLMHGSLQEHSPSEKFIGCTLGQLIHHNLLKGHTNNESSRKIVEANDDSPPMKQPLKLVTPEGIRTVDCIVVRDCTRILEVLDEVPVK